MTRNEILILTQSPLRLLDPAQDSGGRNGALPQEAVCIFRWAEGTERKGGV